MFGFGYATQEPGLIGALFPPAMDGKEYFDW
jgi:hypothetical protein